MPLSPRRTRSPPKSRGRWDAPFAHAPGEIRGFEERARYMLEIAPEALAAIEPGHKAGFQRRIKRVPLGVVAVVAPWNYPYLTAVNAVLPATDRGQCGACSSIRTKHPCAPSVFSRHS